MTNFVAKNGNRKESFDTVFDRLYPGMKKDRLARYFYLNFEQDAHGDPKVLSSQVFDDQYDMPGEFYPTNGYSMIPDYFKKGLKIQLNQRVSKVDYS